MTKKIAVVTGGMGGLGEAISTKLQDAGCTVVVTHSPGNAGVASWLERMAKDGRQFPAYPVDVANHESCKQCAEKIRTEIQLVAPAGVFAHSQTSVASLSSWPPKM